MTTTTIRDGVVMLLLVLVKKSAAKTHIYYSIYISLLLFSSHEVLETNVREREKRFRSVLFFFLLCFFLPFFHACLENNEIFFVPAKTRKNVSMRKGEEKENFLLFFDAYDEYIIIAHDARTYKKSSL